ncbi:hypothetical protein RRG08_036432 [Elysia crispata]|uniref:Uncharacterized protein n=1 Tax=Elysia crispata TaxID=231223 RepID=A0AAE0ZL84_9GAST|nr:hypothetical protein RRG08_036432 [Elysia crispata]
MPEKTKAFILSYQSKNAAYFLQECLRIAHFLGSICGNQSRQVKESAIMAYTAAPCKPGGSCELSGVSILPYRRVSSYTR